MKRLHACPARCVLTHALLILTLIGMGGCSSVGDGSVGTPAEDPPTEDIGNTDTDADTEEEVERLYAWLDGVYAHMASRGVAPTTIAQALAAANAG